MNKTYRLIWNDLTCTWVAVAECAKGRGKLASGAVLLAAAGTVFTVPLALAAPPNPPAPTQLPTGGQVVAGQAAISQSATVLNINQTSQRAALDWQSFNIGSQAQVNFNQPGASSVTLNRVLDSNPSQIFGRITAPGQVFLTNPNGMYFAPCASVDVGGFTATTHSIGNADFMAGNYRFTRNGATGSIVNEGNLTASLGGYIALLAPEVRNNGVIVAQMGTVALAAGETYELQFDGNNTLANIRVEPSTIKALVENGNAVQAPGGLIILSAQAADRLQGGVVRNSGALEATGLVNNGGRIILDASDSISHTGTIRADAAPNSAGKGGTVTMIASLANPDSSTTIDGSISARGGDLGGDGGFVETSAATVNVGNRAFVDTLAQQGATGTWLIDPNDYTVASSGGNITGAALASSLNSTNVTIATATQGTAGGNGDIFVNDTVTKTGSSATTLTLLADRSIAINAPITSSSGRLNVTLTADILNAGTGDVSFGATGRVVTKDGNFYVGSISGSYDTLTAKGRNFTMATGSYIDAGMGNLGISVTGGIALPNNSAQATTYALTNTGYRSLVLSSSGGAITTANTNATTADIITSVDTTLKANNIGTSGTPIKVSGPADLLGNPVTSTTSFPSVAKTLYTTNTAGSSYINEIGTQVFKTVYLTVGSQTSSTQNVQIMGDAGGNGTTGTGHIILNTDGAGLLNVATGNIKTAGLPGTSNPNTDPQIWPTSVTVNAPNITFANNSVDTGSVVPYYLYPGSNYTSSWGDSYYASFVASATGGTGTLSSTQVDTTGDIKSYNTTLNAVNIGTPTNPVELGAGSYLNVNNTGGSTYIKSVGNDFSQLYLTNVKTSGTHSILFSGGDHIDYTTNGNGILLPTISGSAGIDVHNSSRTLTLTANSGYVEFDTNSVNTGSSNFTTSIYNIDRNAGKAIYAKNAKDAAAEITAGNAYFNIYNLTLGHISDIEIAKGGVSSTNSLTINTYQGNVDVTELTENHFKSLNVTLNGASLAQTVAIALAGLDDVNFFDSGSLVTIDATKVNLSSNNRNWNLQASNRTIEVDGVSLGTGSYTLYGGSGLKLNSDVMTNGGNISLTGGGSTGIALMKSLRIDSNADDINNSASTGSAGSISLSGTISGVTSGYALTVDSGSMTTSGNVTRMYNGTGNGGGAYLSGLTLTSKGSTDTNDGYIYLYSNYLLNGNFLSTGKSYMQSNVTIDTEQGNVAGGGNITFAGQNLFSQYYYSNTFNTATTAAGLNAGNVDLYGTYSHSPLSLNNLTVTATSASGTAGNISLPSVSSLSEGYSNTQSYTGGIITLNGNLSTNRGSVTLTGDTRLASNVTIDTWSSASSSYSNGTAGSVTINGTGVSATAADRTLTVNTGTNTGTGYVYVTGTTYWNHSGGAVNIKAGNSGGNYLSSLTVDTTKGGTYNNGTNGNLTLSGIATTGNQTYTGGATTIAGDLTSNGGNINLSGVSSLALSGSPISIDTDRAGGSSAAGTLNIGSFALDGAIALTIDTSADGGGASQDLNLTSNPIGSTTPLSSLALKGKIITLGAITASGTVDIATLTNDLTLTGAVSTSNTTASAIILNAGKNTVAGTSSGGNILISGGSISLTGGGSARATLYSGSISGSTGLTTLVGSGGGKFRYNSDESATNYTDALGTGTYAIYREQPIVTVTASDDSKTYNGAAYNGGNGVSYSGFVNGDTSTALGGTLAYGGASQGAINTGSYIITPSGYTSGLGYALSYANGTMAITPAALTVTGANTSVTYTGLAQTNGAATVSGLQNSDNFTVSGYGTGTNYSVNAYADTLVAAPVTGTLANNYSISYTDGGLSIGKANATVTAHSVNVTYTGLAQSVSGYTATGLLNGQTTSVLSGVNASGATGTNAATYTNTVSGTDSNYNLTLVSGSLVIGKAGLVVTADNKTRIYGDVNPALTYTVTGYVNGEGASTHSGAPTIATAASVTSIVGNVAITAAANNLTSSNYSFSYANGTLTIDPALPGTTAPVPSPPPVPVVVAPPLPAPTSSPPPLTAPVSAPGLTLDPGTSGGSTSAGAGDAGSGGISVSLVRQPSVQQAGIITVSVPKEMATAGSGFSFSLPSQLAETAAVGNAEVRVTTLTGGPLPGWLRYVPETRAFSAAAVPDGAFPMQVLVNVGGAQFTVVISERIL